MAIRCSVEDLGINQVITSQIEHHAVLHTLEELAHKGKIGLHFVNLSDNGHIDTIHLESLLAAHPGSLVSLMHSNNEIGNMIDLDEVSNLCKKYQAVFHCDTVQTIGHQPIDLKKTEIGFVIGAAHKFNGPKGIGFIYINSNLKINPLITGGSQERNMRGGTENVYGIVGLAKALEYNCAHMEADHQYIQSLKNYMMVKLRQEIPGIKFNGDAEGRSAYTVLNVCFPPSEFSEMMIYKLDIEGISCSGGSACSSGSNVGSHVLAAIGVPNHCTNVRFSFGRQNTLSEIDQVIHKLKSMFLQENPVEKA
jgi:cysteine desulfurase